MKTTKLIAAALAAMMTTAAPAQAAVPPIHPEDFAVGDDIILTYPTMACPSRLAAKTLYDLNMTAGIAAYDRRWDDYDDINRKHDAFAAASGCKNLLKKSQWQIIGKETFMSDNRGVGGELIPDAFFVLADKDNNHQWWVNSAFNFIKQIDW